MGGAGGLVRVNIRNIKQTRYFPLISFILNKSGAGTVVLVSGVTVPGQPAFFMQQGRKRWPIRI
jgi:hypothetical protein